MAKKFSDTLTTRLKKQYGSPSPETEKPSIAPLAQSETARVEDPKPKRGARQSVLTPSYIVKLDSDKTSTQTIFCKYFVAADMNERLQEVLREASPFATPLSATKLIELIYCELQNSSALQKRLKDQRDHISIGKYRRQSTLYMPDFICEYIQSAMDEKLIKSLTHFLAWCIQDWDYIRQHVTYQGIK